MPGQVQICARPLGHSMLACFPLTATTLIHFARSLQGHFTPHFSGCHDISLEEFHARLEVGFFCSSCSNWRIEPGDWTISRGAKSYLGSPHNLCSTSLKHIGHCNRGKGSGR